METKTLSKELKTYDFRLVNANLKIYKDNIEKPLIKQDGCFLVTEGYSITKIEHIARPKRTKTFLYTDTIELILPNNSNNEEIFISSCLGNINLKDLILNKLIISHTNGNIKLEDVDSLFTKIELMHGDIITEIKESIFNYTTQINGNCEQSTIENMNSNNIPVFLDNKHHLNINNIDGNIKILFKGKR